MRASTPGVTRLVVALAGAMLLAACGAGAPVPAAPTDRPPATAATAPAPAEPDVPVTSTTVAATTTTAAPAPVALRGLPVVRSTVALVDPSRPTVSRGRRLAPSRPLTTTVVAPAGTGPWPLVLFAHGYQLGPPAYAALVDAIAGAGYVVAAPSFPLADAAVGGAAIDRGDIPNQSGDLRFVADQLTAGAARDPRIDPTRIGAAGHSDGADTVLDLGYHGERRDPRVKAVAALSADAVALPGASATGPPLLLVHGTADRITPYAESTALLARVPVRRWLLSLVGADHLPPVQGAAPWAGPLVRAVLAVLDVEVAGRAVPPGEDLAGAAVVGVAELRPT